MKKISKTAENRLYYQASEARDLGLEKLAEAISGVLYNNELTYDEDSYSEEQLKDYIYHGLWRMASSIMSYYKVENPDASKIDEEVKHLQELVFSNFKKALKVKKDFGPFEPSIPGEDKNLE